MTPTEQLLREIKSRLERDQRLMTKEDPIGEWMSEPSWWKTSTDLVKLMEIVENLQMVCRRLSAAKSLEARDKIAKQCYELFAGNPLRDAIAAGKGDE